MPSIIKKDENTIVVGGIEYKKVIPPTLYDTLRERRGDIPMGRVDVCNAVRDWIIDHTVIETEDDEKITVTFLKQQLEVPK
jgi:hypothetical protein